jgi:hypothetical protein
LCDVVASADWAIVEHVADEHGWDETKEEDAVSAAAATVPLVPLCPSLRLCALQVSSLWLHALGRPELTVFSLVGLVGRTVKSMGELNVEGATNAWKETGNGRPQSDVTNPSLAVARPVLGKTRLGAVTEATSMVQAPSQEFLKQNVWHNNTNEGILSTVQPGARMDFRRRKSDVTRC